MGRYLFPYIQSKGGKDVEPGGVCSRGRKGTRWSAELRTLASFHRGITLVPGSESAGVHLPKTITWVLYSLSTKWV